MKAFKFLFLFVFSIIFIPNINGQKFKDKSQSKELTRNNQTYFFNEIGGVGDDIDKLPRLECSELNILKETNSIWMKWKVKEAGLLAFTIAPILENDDIDFVVFKSNGKALESVRCMASGSNLIQVKAQKDNCKEITGLSFSSSDLFESEGCSGKDDNFLKYLNCKKDEEYYLLVNNHNSSAGFTISFEGSSSFTTDKKSEIRKSNDNINIYPNPTSDFLFVSANFDLDQILDVRIYNSQGNLISREQLAPHDNIAKLNIQNLHAGAYFLQINQNDQKITHSFIKN